jgi:hypothetical protein
VEHRRKQRRSALPVEVPLPGPAVFPSLAFPFAGFWEIQTNALEECARRVQIVGVRERDEFDGPLGHIRGSALIPCPTSASGA